MRRFLSSRFLKFLVVGGGCTVLDFLLFWLIHFVVGLGIVPSNLVSYGTGLAVAFFINRLWTFHDGDKKDARRVWLSLFWGYIGLFINTGIVWALAHSMHAMAAKCVAVVVVLFYNYFTNKYFVFKAKG